MVIFATGIVLFRAEAEKVNISAEKELKDIYGVRECQIEC